MDAKSSLLGVQGWQKPDSGVCTASSVPVRHVRGIGKTNEAKGTDRKESHWDRPSGHSGTPQILVEA